MKKWDTILEDMLKKPRVFDELILADSKKQRRSLDLSVEYHKYKSGML